MKDIIIGIGLFLLGIALQAINETMIENGQKASRFYRVVQFMFMFSSGGLVFQGLHGEEIYKKGQIITT
jgi:hypothetical protein